MTYRVLIFGPYAAAMGGPSVEVCCPQAATATAGEVLRHLAEQHPRLGPMLTQAMLAVNQEYVTKDHPVQISDELALIGMVSGG